MAPQSRIPVLVVDDEEEAVAYVRSILEREGYEAVCASTAAAACEAMRRQDFAVVLVDLRLREASGLDVIAFARQHAPVSVGVIMTAFGSAEAALQALREGAFDFLLKPFAPEVLLAAVRGAAAHHTLNRDLVGKVERVAALEQRLQGQARLLENISHEFKNPLSVVYGYAAHLLKQHPREHTPEEIRRGLSSIHGSAQRLTSLLEDLLDSTRLGNGKLSLDRAPASGWELACASVDDHLPAASQREQVLEMTGCDPGLTVSADARRIRQVLDNLVGNALKFTPAGGSVSVCVEPCAEGARFCVRDTGVGIHPEDLPHLFERFYRCGRERSEIPGLGLGLEISRALVELHGGRIWAESVLEQGSAFYFTLPLAVPAPAAES